MVAIFDGSPMPNHRIRSGSRAILGIGNSADTIGMPAARAAEKIPMASPTARPAAVPISQPGMMRPSEAVTWPTSVPSCHSATNAFTTLSGLGMKSGGSRPVLDAACHSAIRTANTTHGRTRRGAGAKPPPRKGTGWRSDTLHLAIGGGGLVADQRPELALHLGDDRGALGHRRVDADDLADPARPARQHDDPIGEPRRLLEIVGYVHARAPLARPDAQQVFHQELARLRVERRERLVEQQHGRSHHQRAGDADALAHAAG